MDQLLGFMGKALGRSIVIGVMLVLLFLLIDAKNDVRRAEERADKSDLARQKSDAALAKTERECSDRLNELWVKFLIQGEQVQQLEKRVDKSLKRLKQ